MVPVQPEVALATIWRKFYRRQLAGCLVSEPWKESRAVNCLDRETALRMWTENVTWFSNEEGKKLLVEPVTDR
jgi:predicted amidohydrolase YtcJ